MPTTASSKVVVKQGPNGKWYVHMADGTRILGTHDTRQQAIDQQRAIYASLHRKHGKPKK